MSVKALRKQLLAAVAMVIVAAIAVSSSTFAWFAANTTVAVEDMTVTAQSDTVFLQIKGTGGTATEGTIAANGNDFGISGGNTFTNVKVYPTAHEDGLALANIKAAKADPATDSEKWYYGYSDLPTEATLNPTTKTSVKVADFNKYVVEVTYQVKITDDSGADTAYDLYVKDITLPADTGITAVVAGADAIQEFKSTVADNTATAVALSNTVTKTAQTVTVYLYIDGDNANVFTNNIAALTGAVSLHMACYTADTL